MNRADLRKLRNPVRKTLIGLAAALVTFVAVGDGLPRLPKEIQIQKAEGSMGQVTFRHESHVDLARPSCTECHPTSFGILETRARGGIKHETMEKGAACGACHGKTAFSFDSCDSCHQQ